MRIGQNQPSFIPHLPLLGRAQEPDLGDVVEIGGERKPSVDQFLQRPEYQNVKPEASAGMLGFFTEKMASQGFPWHLYKVEEGDSAGQVDKTSKDSRVSSFEAWNRLRNGQAVIFQPMRNLNMDLGADNWGALAAAGTLGAGAGTEITKVANFASLSKESRTTGSLGIELRHGAPILVKNVAELKLLHEVYDPQAKINSEDGVAKAANQLSYFTQQNSNGAWRFYQESDTNKVGRMAKAFVENARPMTAIGAAVGAGFGVVLGAITHNWQNALYCAGAGAAVFAGFSGVQAAAAAKKGESINAVEALGKVLDKQEVVFEKVNRRSIGLPFFKDVSWFSDAGPGDRIHNVGELENLAWIYNPPAPKEDKPKDEKPSEDKPKA